MSNAHDLVVVCLSGGIDSTALAHKALEAERLAACVYVKYGQPSQRAELHVATEWCRDHKVKFWAIDVAGLSLFSMASTDDPGPRVVPVRNVIFASIAANIAVSIGATRVWMGATADDASDYFDCREEVAKAMSETLGFAGTRIKVEYPYVSYTKVEVIRSGEAYGMDTTKTISCYAPKGGRHCGKCRSCRERRAATRS